MASPVQKAVSRRKTTYLALMIALFVVNTFLWRGSASATPGREPLAWTMAARAKKLELSEVDAGEADVASSIVTTLFTGSRGFALAALWYESEEMKKKHEWNKLELIVKAITKLQPHLASPWEYQSWNIAYNVSVESDRVSDKYFYISRGIELMGEGIRRNRDNPDLRYKMGFYYQNKFGVSDEANTLRCLLQLSCIDPRERVLRWRPDNADDRAEFEKFVRAHPQLVRRLRDKLNYSAAQIVDFLTRNRSVPSRYYRADKSDPRFGLKPPTDQFPALPAEPSRLYPSELTQESNLDDSFDSYQCARAWFSYAQDPLPEPEPQLQILERVDRVKKLKERNKRIPRQPAEVIFRAAPARAQSFVAERLEKEGWFDESGWNVDEDRHSFDRWFPESREPVIVGSRRWAQDNWERAAEMWEKHGRANGLYYEVTELSRLNDKAELYRKTYKVAFDEFGKELFDEPNVAPEMMESFIAHRKLQFYRINNEMSNFDHHYYRSQAEKDPLTIHARELLFDAVRLRNKVSEHERTINRYREALDAWVRVLMRYPRQFRDDSTIQEDVYERQIEYNDLIAQIRGPVLPALRTQSAVATVGDFLAATSSKSLGAIPAATVQLEGTGPLPWRIHRPLDARADDGRPWVEASVADMVYTRLGRENPSAPKKPADGGPEPKPGAPATDQKQDAAEKRK